MSDRKVIGQVTIIETTERTYDVFEGDWDFDATEDEPTEEDMNFISTLRGSRLTIDDVDWKFERES